LGLGDRIPGPNFLKEDLYMKYLKQFLIILAVSLMGEILKAVLPLPIPASIYGMVLMFVFLLTGVIKLSQVRETGRFLIEIMPVMFIPAGVGLMSSWNVLEPVLLPVSIITVITIFTVMGATGLISQFIIRRSRKEAN
jgi:holin-like protein